MGMEDIIELIQLFCIQKGCKYRDNYSGRGMFGRTCAGIVTNNANRTIGKLIEYLVRQGIDYEEALGNICTDNMGLGFIVYFPSVSTKPNN